MLEATVTATCDKCGYEAELSTEDNNLEHPTHEHAVLSVIVYFKNVKQTKHGKAMAWAHYYNAEMDDFIDVCPYCLARIADSGC